MGDQKLQLAVGAALAEVVVLIGVLVAQGALSGAPLRIGFLATKIPFCVLARRRKPAAFLALWVYEIAALAAAGTASGPVAGRATIAAAAVVVMVLLGRATSAFPPVEWKTR
jgi:hypothetical protein